MKYCKG